MPLVGCYEKCCGILESMREMHYPFTNVDVIYRSVAGPINKYAQDYVEGKTSTHVAKARLKQHLDWVEEEFGLYYPCERPTLELVVEKKWDDWEGLYDFDLWTLYVTRLEDIDLIWRVIGNSVDIHPSDIIDEVLDAVTFLAVETVDEGYIYVLKSSRVQEGFIAKGWHPWDSGGPRSCPETSPSISYYALSEEALGVAKGLWEECSITNSCHCDCEWTPYRPKRWRVDSVSPKPIG